jgi:hypothetical protein
LIEVDAAGNGVKARLRAIGDRLHASGGAYRTRRVAELVR